MAPHTIFNWKLNWYAHFITNHEPVSMIMMIPQAVVYILKRQTLWMSNSQQFPMPNLCENSWVFLQPIEHSKNYGVKPYGTAQIMTYNDIQDITEVVLFSIILLTEWKVDVA